MATRRMLAASISVSEQVANLRDDFTRLLFTWMIAHADDYGVLHGSPARIRAVVVPMLECTNAQVEAALADMEANELIWRYEVGKVKYVQLRTWEHYQDLHKRTAPKLPLFPGCEAPSRNFPEVPGLARAPGTELNRTRTEQNRERENARAKGNVMSLTTKATADAAPVSLSLSKKAEKTPEQKPEPNLLYEPFVATLKYKPESGSERGSWRKYLDLLRDEMGTTPDLVPKLVRQYRDKYGDKIPCNPKTIYDHYGELGVSPHVYAATGTGTDGANVRPHAPSSAAVYTPEAAARKRELLAAARNSGGGPVPALTAPSTDQPQ